MITIPYSSAPRLQYGSLFGFYDPGPPPGRRVVSQLSLVDSVPVVSVSHAQTSGANNLYLAPEEAEQTFRKVACWRVFRASIVMVLGLGTGMKCRHFTVHRTARVGRDGGQQSMAHVAIFLASGLVIVPDLEREHQLVSNRWRVIAGVCQCLRNSACPELKARRRRNGTPQDSTSNASHRYLLWAINPMSVS